MRAEQPAAQVPSGGAKPLRMSCEADGVPLNALEHAARKDDLVTLDPGQLVEAHLGRTELTALERDHAPPEDVAPSDLAAEVCLETFGVLAGASASTPTLPARGPNSAPVATRTTSGPDSRPASMRPD